MKRFISALALCMWAGVAHALTPAGTQITNSASVAYNFGSGNIALQSPTVIDVVDELIDVEVQTLETVPVPGAPGSSNRVVRFEVTNLGNGTEAFTLAIDNNQVGNLFDPLFASIYFDDGDGSLNATSDTLYEPGINERLLGSTGSSSNSVTVFVLNHLPLSAVIGETGDSQLTATALTASGTGTVIDGAGDEGTDIVVGFTGGIDDDSATYIIEDAVLTADKSVTISHPDYGPLPEAIPGATLRYTIRINVVGTATLEDLVFRDPVPAGTTFETNSISLNTIGLTDTTGDDAGEWNDTANEVVVRLGDLSAADIEQVIIFETTLNEVQP